MTRRTTLRLHLPLAAAAALAFACLPAAPAAAQVAAPKIVLETKASLLSTDAKTGKPSRKPAKRAKTNETVEYVVAWANKGTGPAPDVTVTNPIPSGTVYLLGSAEGKGAKIVASADGGATFAPPPLRVNETMPDGTVVSVEAPPEAYTHLRWRVPGPVAPGASGTVSFKVRVR